MGLKETGWDEMDWIHLAQDRQMAGNEHLDSLKCE